MQVKLKKWIIMLLIVAAVINILGWIGFASAMYLSGDYIIFSIICTAVSSLIGFSVLAYIINSKITLFLKGRKN